MDNTVLKHDLVTGATEGATFVSGASAGDFVLVPRADDAAEDDGVLMGFVHRPATDTSDLVLLDAGSLETVAEVHLPVRVPHGFHGNWVPS
jgi:carotenoid cleavage dioxygenase